jgi:hypothetical protein
MKYTLYDNEKINKVNFIPTKIEEYYSIHEFCVINLVVSIYKDIEK